MLARKSLDFKTVYEKILALVAAQKFTKEIQQEETPPLFSKSENFHHGQWEDSSSKEEEGETGIAMSSGSAAAEMAKEDVSS